MTTFGLQHVHPALEEQEEAVASVTSRVTRDSVSAFLENFGLRLISFSWFREANRGVINPIVRMTVEGDTRQQREMILRLTNPHRFWRRTKTTLEVNTMSFVRSQTTIPVPVVRSFSCDEATSPLGCEFILMDSIPGETLADLLPKMTRSETLSVFSEVAGFVSQLNRIKLRGEAATMIGTFSRAIGDFEHLGPVSGDGPTLGPFSDFAEQFAANVSHALFTIERDPIIGARHGHLVPLLHGLLSEQTLEKVSRDTRGSTLALNHWDINTSNILVHPETFHVTGLLDWEQSCIAAWDHEWFKLLELGEELGIDGQDVKRVLEGVSKGTPNPEVRKCMDVIETVRGLCFFCSTWYQSFPSFEARKQASIDEGLECSRRLASVIESTFPGTPQ